MEPAAENAREPSIGAWTFLGAFAGFLIGGCLCIFPLPLLVAYGLYLVDYQGNAGAAIQTVMMIEIFIAPVIGACVGGTMANRRRVSGGEAVQKVE